MFVGKIPSFNLYKKKPNEIHFGSLYTKRIDIPCSPEKKRTLRVWLPDNYDNKKKFGVIYMSDGQNMVDKYTSPFGEWNMEDHITNLQKEGYPGFILVGIDCPKDPSVRCAEYSTHKFTNNLKVVVKEAPNMPPNYGSVFMDYIVNNIKPMIDSHFKTIQEFNGFIGSSMGGLFSFEIVSKYPDIFNFGICYSPALCLYKNRQIKLENKKWNPNPSIGTKYVFYSGGGDKYERQFVKVSKNEYKFLRKQGFNKSQVMLVIDKKEIHHEDAWSKHIEDSLKFVLESSK